MRVITGTLVMEDDLIAYHGAPREYIIKNYLHWGSHVLTDNVMNSLVFTLRRGMWQNQAFCVTYLAHRAKFYFIYLFPYFVMQ